MPHQSSFVNRLFDEIYEDDKLLRYRPRLCVSNEIIPYNVVVQVFGYCVYAVILCITIFRNGL